MLAGAGQAGADEAGAPARDPQQAGQRDGSAGLGERAPGEQRALDAVQTGLVVRGEVDDRDGVVERRGLGRAQRLRGRHGGGRAEAAEPGGPPADEHEDALRPDRQRVLESAQRSLGGPGALRGRVLRQRAEDEAVEARGQHVAVLVPVQEGVPGVLADLARGRGGEGGGVGVVVATTHGGGGPDAGRARGQAAQEQPAPGDPHRAAPFQVNGMDAFVVVFQRSTTSLCRPIRGGPMTSCATYFPGFGSVTLSP